MFRVILIVLLISVGCTSNSEVGSLVNSCVNVSASNFGRMSAIEYADEIQKFDDLSLENDSISIRESEDRISVIISIGNRKDTIQLCGIEKMLGYSRRSVQSREIVEVFYHSRNNKIGWELESFIVDDEDSQLGFRCYEFWYPPGSLEIETWD